MRGNRVQGSSETSRVGALQHLPHPCSHKATGHPVRRLQRGKSLIPSVMAALLTVVACVPVPAREPAVSVPATTPDRTAREPQRLALLVGCSDYPVLEGLLDKRLYEARVRLDGPVNDVALLGDVLLRCLGFNPEQITCLSGWPQDAVRRPTRANILAQLSRLAAEVEPGAEVLILLAGHGVQQPDHDGDERDGWDEVFLPADVSLFESRDGRIPGALVDDEIGRSVQAIRNAGAFVWLIMDTCHSGTMTRGEVGELRFRQIERDLLGLPRLETSAEDKRAEHDTGPALDLVDLDEIVAFYAAQSFHKAPELPLPRHDPAARPHGLLTYMVAQQLTRSAGELTFRELMTHVMVSYQALPYEATVPLAEGDLERSVAGERHREEHLLLVRRDKSGLILEAGKLMGFERGTLLELHPAGEAESEACGVVEIVAAGLAESSCEVIGGKELEPLADGTRPDVYYARVIRMPFGDHSVKIAAVTPAGHPCPLSSLPDEVRACLTEHRFQFPLADDPATADWLLVCDDGELWLEPAKRGGGSFNRFAVAPQGLLRELRQIFRSQNLKRLAGSGLVRGLEPGLEVQVLRRTDEGEWARVRQGETLEPGAMCKVALRNDTGRTYDVTVLFLDANHGIQVFFPPGMQTPRLSHLDTRLAETPCFEINDESLGLEHLLVIAMPREQASHVIDLSWLAQEPLQAHARRGSGPWEEIDFTRNLYELAFGSSMRGIELASNEALAPTMLIFTWRTEWPELGPPRTWMGGAVGPLQQPPATSTWPSNMPDPWRVGSRGCLVRSPASASQPDLILAGNDVPSQVFIDLDEDSPAGSVQQLLAGRLFDAEAIFHFASGQTTAFYDRNNDGRFDLILVDRDQDPEADRCFSLAQEGWHVDEDVAMPWLSTAYLTYLRGALDARERQRDVHQAVAKFRVLASSTASEPVDVQP
ncbi:MAG: caspase family protein [Planctomycetota bacterium]